MISPFSGTYLLSDLLSSNKNPERQLMPAIQHITNSREMVEDRGPSILSGAVSRLLLVSTLPCSCQTGKVAARLNSDIGKSLMLSIIFCHEIIPNLQCLITTLHLIYAAKYTNFLINNVNFFLTSFLLS